MEICISDLAAYIFECSDSKEVKTNEECTTKNIAICYCTGDKCDPEDPTNSANNIGAQATFGFTVFLAFFNKVLAWIIAPSFLIMLSSPLKRSIWFSSYIINKYDIDFQSPPIAMPYIHIT